MVSYSAGGPGDTGPPDGGGGPAGSGGDDDPFASRPSTPQPRMPAGPGRVPGSGGVETPPELGGSPGTAARGAGGQGDLLGIKSSPPGRGSTPGGTPIDEPVIQRSDESRNRWPAEDTPRDVNPFANATFSNAHPSSSNTFANPFLSQHAPQINEATGQAIRGPAWGGGCSGFAQHGQGCYQSYSTWGRPMATPY